MPPKKKGYSSGKKKKGGAAASRTHQRVASSSTANRDNSSSHSSHRDPFRALGKENLPTFHDANRGGSSGGSSGGGYYETYKRATTHFCEWMKGVSAQLGMEKMKSVNDLRKGADAVLSRNLTLLTAPPPPDPIVAPLEIIKALETGIKYREIFTRTTFGSEEGGDKGHWYMAQVLKYCQAALVQSRKVARIVVEVRASTESPDDDGGNATPEDKDEVDRIGGRFHALLSIFEDEPEDDEDDEEEKERIRRGDLPALEVELPPAPTEDIDIERDLIEGDDTFQAWALFHTMDQLMESVDSHYSMLKNYLRGQENFSYESPVQLLLECTATTNLAIQNVRTAEAALIAQHPHISSFYHVLALVFLPMMVADVDKLLSQKRRDQEDHLALDFVASIVECAFHNRGHDRVTGKVKRHTKKMGVSFSVLEIKAQQIFAIMSFEALLLVEERGNPAMLQSLRATGAKPHSWLNFSSYIGDDRCILNTQKIIQMIMDVLNDDKKLVCKAGFWGHDFSENHCPAKSIRAGLDEVLGGHLMPELLEICRQAPFHRLPEMSRLMPVLDMLHNHMDPRQGDRTRPISIALTFGLHSVLTSIFIMQGSGDLARVASLGKRSFETLFGQLDRVCDPSRQPENAPGFYLNVALFKNVANFAKPVWSHVDTHLTMLDPEQTERLAFWNPVIGGGYLLYGTYICSIGLGSATVDSLGQLRFTLHLYNALKKCNSIPVLKIPFLELLEATFSKTKAIWVGGHPDKGSFCQHFWLAWGTSIAYATQLAAECAAGNDELGAQLGRQNIRSSETTR